MPLKLEDLFEDLGIPGIAAGVGAIVLAPVLIPAVAKASKPVAKALIKGGIIAYEKSRSAIIETGEVLEDLVAEVKAEMAEEELQQSFESVEPDFEDS
ncbi:MAG: DUF5132 domain-containing protein [Xenococcaceae cyanobacterium MO_207.B15]|nr:DUF5132 domain-containing protein [Xenococcaceae cyanobacterium MO_207.B15]MDJ0741860.1 DUF5132 domain-containing protein [Xenococcaceae cyanobacterium MO_167.B27]